VGRVINPKRWVEVVEHLCWDPAFLATSFIAPEKDAVTRQTLRPALSYHFAHCLSSSLARQKRLPLLHF